MLVFFSHRNEHLEEKLLCMGSLDKLPWHRAGPFCSGLLGKTRTTGKQSLSPCQRENCPSRMQTTQAPSLHQQMVSQITKPTPDPLGMMGSSSGVIQQSSCWSLLQNLNPHFPTHIEYCKDFTEREQGMGNAGTMVTSSVVQQLSFFYF